MVMSGPPDFSCTTSPGLNAPPATWHLRRPVDESHQTDVDVLSVLSVVEETLLDCRPIVAVALGEANFIAHLRNCRRHARGEVNLVIDELLRVNRRMEKESIVNQFSTVPL